MRKIGLRTQCSLYRLVLSKLAAVVKGDGVHMLGIRSQHLDNRIPDLIGPFALNPFHQIETTLTLC